MKLDAKQSMLEPRGQKGLLVLSGTHRIHVPVSVGENDPGSVKIHDLEDSDTKNSCSKGKGVL